MRIFAFVPILILAMIPAPAKAFDMGPLNRFLEETSSGGWTITDRDGAAVFENTSKPGNVNYYFVDSPRDEEGRREISVDVSFLETSDFSKAGLIYGLEQDPRTYFLFTVDQTKTVRLEYRSTDGWEERISSQVDGLDLDKINLAIREEGNSISLLVNGEKGPSLGNDRIGRGGVGITTIGIGTYSFKNFDVMVPKVEKSQTRTKSPQKERAFNEGQQEQSDTAVARPNKTLKSANATVPEEKSPEKPAIPNGVMHVKSAEIIDRQGFEKPVRAASMLIPVDWKIESNVAWSADECQQGAHVIFDAVAPDQKTSFSRLPATAYAFSSLGRYNSCLFLRAERADDVVEASLQGVLKNLKIVKTERLPNVKAPIEVFSDPSSGLRLWIDQIIITADHDRNGEKHRAFILLQTTHLQTFSQVTGLGIVENLNASALPLIFSGPIDTQKSNTYDTALGMMMNSFRKDPKWQARINRHNKVISDSYKKTAETIHNINRETSDYIFNLNNETHANRTASNARLHQRTVEAITDTQTVLADNGPVLVPAGTVWDVGDGTMLISQETHFDPRDYGVEAKKLEQVR